MIRVTVELVPAGLGKPKHLATVEVTKRRVADHADYDVRVYGKRYQLLDSRSAEVLMHPRRSVPVLTLIRKALQAARF